MNLSIVVFRTFLYYFLFLFLFKVMGKREIGELGVNDLLVSFLFAQFATLAIERYNEPLIITLIPTLIIVSLQILISFISFKNPKFRILIDSSPSMIIKNGKINFKEMERQRYNLEDLLTGVRDRGIKSLDEIEYAILESNGKLSTFTYDNKKTYPLPLIVDGKIEYNNLFDINKDINWLNKVLKQEHTELKNVFYAFYKNDRCYIIKRN